ncbi:MAG: tetratricopeptide repeat protein, partial [Candidatus Omnitrophica bacterium]|nr:tetratricopeptide repeat protein [Candidatus Omnitrophota bacterium]
MRVIRNIISGFLIMVAQSYMGRGEYGKAVKLCLKARNIAPDSSFVLFHLGNAYYFAGYYQEAKDTFSKALYFKPDDIVTLNMMIHVLIELNASTEEIIPYMKLYLKNAELHQIKFPHIIDEMSIFM